jgi:2-hydroxy-3-oxopropionate reductase
METTTVIKRNFKPGFRMRLHRKDPDITLDAGKLYGATLSVTVRVYELMTETINDGQGDMDNSSFVLLLEKLSNPPGTSSQPLP